MAIVGVTAVVVVVLLACGLICVLAGFGLVVTNLKFGDKFELQLKQEEGLRQEYKAEPVKEATAVAEKTLETAPAGSMEAIEAKRYLHEQEVHDALRRLLSSDVQVKQVVIPNRWIDFELVHGDTLVAVSCLTEERMGLGEWRRMPGLYRRVYSPITDDPYVGGIVVFQTDQRMFDSRQNAHKLIYQLG